eukprot:Plantae.Rhodophyta-Hildenbrandia_rubra.ctg9325.p1 GENE.Plantae.Rhodophyta-Hildenbrandia_rubra.ctg9325~~Plantae.Rhodophyta-Hildenbrandia_rubra.ctg9325.p1  ORF type:complete len:104 (+),score=21.60 Plantae.Rhodophyta-Hildenbrandia_rubra.ctg9325:189-500(+)
MASAANLLRSLARRAPDRIAQAKSAEAWETTAGLRDKYIFTTLDAMPARLEAASQEWSALKTKVMARDVTVNELGTGLVRALELYGLYCIGKVIGSKSISGKP